MASSEIRRAARALVATHPSSISSDYSAVDSVARLSALMENERLGPGVVAAASLDGVTIRRRSGETVFHGTWKHDASRLTLEGEFLPAPSIERFLKLVSLFLGLLILSSAWVLLAGDDPSLQASTALVTVLSILAFPILIAGLSSQRAAREATIARHMQRALKRESP